MGLLGRDNWYRLWVGQPRNFMDAEIFPAIWYQLLIPNWVIQVGSWEGPPLCPLSLLLVPVGVFHQRLVTSGPLPIIAGLWDVSG